MSSQDLPRNRYGHFAADGREYVVTEPRTPRPWVNVIANPRLGLVVSQAGSGFTFVDNSQLAVITRWQQDLISDSSGKHLYLRDAASGSFWSLSPAPVWRPDARHTCRHGLGFSVLETEVEGVASRWTLLAHPVATAELWLVEVSNLGERPRSLDLVAYLEWSCGMAPSPRREFTRLFLETWADPERRAVFAANHMWEVPSARWGHWNTDFPFVAGLASSEPLTGVQGDKGAFLGRFGSSAAPAALEEPSWQPRLGRHEDAVAALRCRLELAPGAIRALSLALVVGGSRAEAEELAVDLARPEITTAALDEVQRGWSERLAAHRVQTPEPSLDALVNDWARYQAISARLWARCGYYQQSGAFGFRDQLQDSQVWLTIDPARCRDQLRLHAAHQFADGSVYHWWHPLSEQGHVTRISDDLLWLAFVTASYLKETGDLGVLDQEASFLDDPTPHSLREHVERAFARAFSRFSPRGLPLIGAGDWNDGLSAAGLRERGESVWLGHFLALLQAEWAEVARRDGNPGRAAELEGRRAALVAALNAHGWDGAWYARGTCDDGTTFGSAGNPAGRVYLNAQTWAVLADVAPPERARAAMAAVREHLLDEAGALLLAPAYDTPVPEIGYITRYAPGVRENGGVYTHAATWAIAAAAKMRDAELVGRLLRAINPATKEPERYWAEPYVLPGNVDGPASPYHGRGGWTWYTGSAAWLHRVVSEWVLGVRPEWDGLLVDPCLPPDWTTARIVRPYRGCTYRFVIRREADLPANSSPLVAVDRVPLGGNLILPPARPGLAFAVEVRCR